MYRYGFTGLDARALRVENRLKRRYCLNLVPAIASMLKRGCVTYWTVDESDLHPPVMPGPIANKITLHARDLCNASNRAGLHGMPVLVGHITIDN